MCRQQSRLDGGSKLVAHTDFGYQTFDAYFYMHQKSFFYFLLHTKGCSKKKGDYLNGTD